MTAYSSVESFLGVKSQNKICRRGKNASVSVVMPACPASFFMARDYGFPPARELRTKDQKMEALLFKFIDNSAFF